MRREEGVQRAGGDRVVATTTLGQREPLVKASHQKLLRVGYSQGVPLVGLPERLAVHRHQGIAYGDAAPQRHTPLQGPHPVRILDVDAIGDVVLI